MSRYLITGGCGFIGSHLADALVARGDEVRILDNLSTGRREYVQRQCELVVGDVTDSSKVEAAMADMDGCFHLAAVTPMDTARDDWHDNHRVNLVGTVNVLSASNRQHPDKPVPVVYASSAEVYGDNATLPLSEGAKPHPLTAYGTDKLACEFYARMISMLHKVPTIGVRLFNVYGPRQHPESPYSGIISRMIEHLLKNEPVPLPGSGEQVVDFIYINDVVQILTAAMQQPMQTHEVINACTGKMTSIRQLAAILATIVDRPLQTIAQASGNCLIRTRVGDPSRAIRLLGLKSGTKLGDGLTLTARHILKTRQSGKRKHTSPSPAWLDAVCTSPH